MTEYETQPDATLRLTDDGLELPTFLRGHVGAFTLRTADITGEFQTTDHGLPDTEFYDGVLAAYPDDDGEHNPHLRAGLLSFETPDHHEVVFEVHDERTQEGSDD